MKFRRLALIGCGLMGGSFALALRAAGGVDQVVGFSASSNTRARALALGVIDSACASAAEAAQDADLVLLAVPVGAMSGCLQALRPALKPEALLMDVGSTKGDVVAAARAALGERLSCFVPAHPIAGKEVAGIEHADAQLYCQRRTILTPLPQTGAAQLQAAQAVWQAVGSEVTQMSPEQHDAVFAAVSHLPHLLAFAAINGLTAQSQSSLFLQMAGPGFRDFTRIAASDSSVWRDILQANPTQVLAQLQHFRQALDQLESALTQGDGERLQQLIAQASTVRAGWTLQTGPLVD